jgi:hypothetical protein
LVYLFPGLWKLSLGTAWWAGDNLKWLMYSKWYEAGFSVPWLRLDQVPLLYRLGGLATVLFEVGFLPLVLWRRTRMITLAAGVGFHIMCAVMMRIWFWIAPVLYVMFIDWDALAVRLGLIRARRPGPTRAGRLAPFVASVVIIAAGFAGLTVYDSWPIAGYPTFAYISPISRTALEIVGVDRSENEVPFGLSNQAGMRRRFGDARWHRLLDRVATTQNTGERQGLTLAVIDVVRRSHPSLPALKRYRVYKVTRSIDPVHWHDPPLSITLLDEFAPPDVARAP